MIKRKTIYKLNFTLAIFIFISTFFYNCSNKSNNPDFIEKASGRYLYNSDEVINIYFDENELFMAWRGAKKIKPLKINDSTFYVKEMNEKIVFLTALSDKIEYIGFLPKEENMDLEYNFRKLKQGEKLASEYLLDNEFDKALEAYSAIKKKDSLDTSIVESNLNSKAYKELRDHNFEYAIRIFKINAALYPKSSNVYDSLGEAFMKSGDTIQALANYKKSLELDSANSRAKRMIDKLEKK